MVPPHVRRARAARAIVILCASAASGCGLLLSPGDDAIGRDAAEVDGGTPQEAATDAPRLDAPEGDGSAGPADGDTPGGDAASDAPAAPTCFSAFGDIAGCNDMAGTCAWFSCGSQCLPGNPGIGTSCGCRHITSDRPLCESDPVCEWDAMSGRCEPRTSTGVSVCTRYPDATSCGGAGCRWLECVRTCYPAETPLSSVCGCWRYTTAASCEGDPLCTWGCDAACVPRTVDLVALCGA